MTDSINKNTEDFEAYQSKIDAMDSSDNTLVWLRTEMALIQASATNENQSTTIFKENMCMVKLLQIIKERGYFDYVDASDAFIETGVIPPVVPPMEEGMHLCWNGETWAPRFLTDEEKAEQEVIEAFRQSENDLPLINPLRD